MPHVAAALRRAVVARARRHCEYCGLAQAGQAATFHIDHVIPRVAGGETSLTNLALACGSCSLSKGAQQFANDPATAFRARVFDPRKQRWADHFEWSGIRIVGRTPTGRATARLLRLNRAQMLEIRTEEKLLHRHHSPEK